MWRILRRARVPIACSTCGHESWQILAWLQAHQAITCHGCGRTVPVDGAARGDAMRRAVSLADELGEMLE